MKEQWLEYEAGIITRAGEDVVLPTAKWHQTAPYNWMCPKIDGRYALAGCVATAQAIIMKYHEYPAKAIGGVSSYDGNAVVYNAYDWDNMLNEYPYKQYSDKEGYAVAELMWHCGANVEMHYALDGSGAATAYVATSLIHNFGYDKQTRYIHSGSYKKAIWRNLIKQEINANRPILYSGGNHAFICDGYSSTEKLFHFNWGWDGYCDGFFRLELLNPAGFNFSETQYMIIGIQPDKGNDYVKELRLFNAKMSEEVGLKGMISSLTNIETNKSFDIGVAFKNGGNMIFNGVVNIALVDKGNNIRTIIGREDYAISDFKIYYNGIRYIECFIPSSIKLEKTDKLVTVYREDNDKEWRIMEGGEDVYTEIPLVFEPPVNYIVKELRLINGENSEGTKRKDMVCSLTEIETNKSFYIINSFENAGNLIFRGNVNIALVDKDYKIRTIVGGSDMSIQCLKPNWGYTNITFSCFITSSIKLAGSDKLVTVYKEKNAKGWKIMKGDHGAAWEIPVSSDDPAVGIEEGMSRNIYALQGTIVVENMTPCLVSVYTVSGKLLKQITYDGGQMQVPMPKGLYFVRAKNESLKVFVP